MQWATPITALIAALTGLAGALGAVKWTSSSDAQARHEATRRDAYAAFLSAARIVESYFRNHPGGGDAKRAENVLEDLQRTEAIVALVGSEAARDRAKVVRAELWNAGTEGHAPPSGEGVWTLRRMIDRFEDITRAEVSAVLTRRR